MPSVSVSKYVVMAGWDDVPHLSEEQKRRMLDGLPPHMRDARSKGIPHIGSGAIYPISEDDIVTDAVAIPDHWPRAYGMDVGWRCTAAVWGAWDRDRDVLYITDEYARGEAEPASHAQAIKMRGEWIPGVIDPASQGRSQVDGRQLAAIYQQDYGLQLDFADNSVEAGIFEVWQRMTTGRLKIFRHCVKLLAELRIYHRDEKGRIVKEHDHLMDCMRYLCRSGLAVASLAPMDDDEWERNRPAQMQGRSVYGGY